tara:strand:- start:4949 stop:5299 length:351 start_codon:yes stop_codon:yes gene_type:complete
MRKSILIKRWGKVGTVGQTLVEIIEGNKAANKYHFECDKRSKKGYRVSRNDSLTDDGVAISDLPRVLGTTVFTKAATHIQTVFHGDMGEGSNVEAKEFATPVIEEIIERPEEYGTW